MLSKIGYWVLMILILLAMNTATIVWLAYNFTPFINVEGVDISLWDANLLKKALELKPEQYLSVAEKGAIYMFMVIGGLCSAMFVKWLFLDTVKRVRDKKKNKDLKKHLKDYEN